MQAGVYYLNAMIYSIVDEDREKNNRLLGICYIKMVLLLLLQIYL